VTKGANRTEPPVAAGLVMHGATFYDLTVWLITLGRERAFRQKIVRLARLKAGESVLDVGCGTGSLAIAAKRQVGLTGTVCGIDASPEMLARAAKKARATGLEIVFTKGAAQALPFPADQFDAVLTSMMLHHLPRKGREQCAQEIARVLKPGGRVLAVDFAAPGERKRRPLIHFHRHGHSDVNEIFAAAGFGIIEDGAVGFLNLRFILGTAPPRLNYVAGRERELDG